MINKLVHIASEFLNGLAVFGLAYVVCMDVTLQDIVTWLTR